MFKDKLGHPDISFGVYDPTSLDWIHLAFYGFGRIFFIAETPVDEPMKNDSRTIQR